MSSSTPTTSIIIDRRDRGRRLDQIPELEDQSRFDGITELFLCEFWIGSDACKSIYKFLKVTTSLKEFSLANNEIDDEGIGLIMEGLQYNNSVTKLQLIFNMDCSFSVEACKAVSGMLTKSTTLKTLHFGRSCAMDAEGFGIIMNGLAHNSSITSLTLQLFGLNNQGCESVYKMLITNTTVEDIDLSRNKINNEGIRLIMEGLIRNNSVTRVNLGCSHFDKEGCKSIFKMLTKNTTLTDLFLGGNNIDGEGIDIIMGALVSNSSRVAVLKLNRIKKSCKSISKVLGSNTTLTEISLGFDKHIDDEGLGTVMGGFVHNKSVIKLKFYGCNIGKKGCKSISDMLASNTTLTDLDLGDNEIDDEGIGVIMEGLKGNKSMTHLHLGLSDLNNKRIHDNGYEHILEMMQSNFCLKQIIFGTRYGGNDYKEFDWSDLENPRWFGNEDVIHKILFRLGLNRTGLLQAIENDNNALISHEEWVGKFLNVFHTDTSLNLLCKINGIDDDCGVKEDRFCGSANLSSSFFFLQKIHDKIIKYPMGKNVNTDTPNSKKRKHVRIH